MTLPRPEVVFCLPGPCNQRCPYCILHQEDSVPDGLVEKLDYCCSMIARSLLPVTWRIMGAELTYFPLEVQEQILAVMKKYSKEWTLFTNGYDCNSPIYRFAKHKIYHVVDGTLRDVDQNVFIITDLDEYERVLGIARCHPDKNIVVRMDDYISCSYWNGDETRLVQFLPLLGVSSISELEQRCQEHSCRRLTCGVNVEVQDLMVRHCRFVDKREPIESTHLITTGDFHGKLCQDYMDFAFNRVFKERVNGRRFN